jgi:ATP-dependent helicase YprA (DUF1998 family)
MQNQRIDPIKASEHIREVYLRYLTTTFGLKEQELANQFRLKARETAGLFSGPILEATPKYKKGKSLLELTTEKNSILSQEFLNYAPGLDLLSIKERIPLERELYLHQEKALRRAIGENRNIVIATGTGSGKTECYLYPIIDHLLKERSAGKLGPGVRALIVYPMNALANDQVYRLRKILPPETGITFGRYTGQTEQTYYKGLDAYRQENENQLPQANELFCRDQILGLEPTEGDWPHPGLDPFIGPPHILLTNFAMLEYLLMRPQDTPLFDGLSGDTWRFLVFDEAHVYGGALGTEISYLIRRVKDRVCRSKAGKLKCIATSATIGARGTDSKKIVASSFSNIFGEEFNENDVLTGEVIPPDIFLEGMTIWGKGSKEFYTTLKEIIYLEHKSVPAFIELLRERILNKIKSGKFSGWPDQKVVLETIESIQDYNDVIHASEVFLFKLLGGDRRLRLLIEKLEKEPIDLINIPDTLCDDIETVDKKAAQISLIELVDLASRARLETDSAPLLGARYHFFVRSLEGLSICLVQGSQKNSGWQNLLIGRHQEVDNAPGGTAVAFELRSCMRCGQAFLHGYLTDDGRFISYPKRTRLDEKSKPETHFTIDLNEAIEPPEDEDPLREEKPPVSSEDDMPDSGEGSSITSTTIIDQARYLCPRCGYISNNNTSNCQFCFQEKAIISNEWIEVRRVHAEKGGVIKVCPACGGRKYSGGSIIHAFSPGDDAAGAVLSQSLMTNIPPTIENEASEKVEDYQPKGRFTARIRMEKSNAFTRGKHRLLAFSDSRQDAAYFSTYLNRTADQILHRQLILKAIRKLINENPGITLFGCIDIINPLISEAQEVGLFSPGATEIERKTEVSKWLTAELASIQRRYGLEGVGLLSWQLKYRDQIINNVKEVESGIHRDYSLNAVEFTNLLELFLTELRKQNVLQPIYNTPIRDPYFWPRNRPYSIRQNHVHSKLSIASWFPQASRNIRSEFLERLFAKVGIESDSQKINSILSDLWELSNIDQIPIWEDVPSVNTLWGGSGKDGAVKRVRWDAWLGQIEGNRHDLDIYKCDTCGSLSHINLKDICPTYRCPGKLNLINSTEEFKDNHYRYLYNSQPISINVAEHTAQITNQEGSERQRAFCSDTMALNILSCSTTFELGVDVGQLHAVFMRNVPPTIANYVQRSGRAGRRLSAAAFVLTFCRSRPHDLGYFDVSKKLISGEIQASMVKIDNIRIARRHLHAVVLSRFWRSFHPELFNGPEKKRRGIVQWIFFEPPETGAKMVYEWLKNKPKDLFDEIKRIFPADMGKELGLEIWRWVDELVSKPLENSEKKFWEGRLGIAQSELRSEYQEYEKLQVERPNLYNLAEAQKKRIRERQILDFLASRNVLPKYGFPVDVVSLKIQSTDEWAQQIELDRDLRIALSEYAPGCTLVANGRVIKSYALEKIPGKAWPEYRFVICRQCGKFHRSEISEGEIVTICECGQSLEKSEDIILKGTFIEPAYGFRTSINEDGQPPVEVRPQRTFSTRVYFSHYNWVHEEPFLNEGTSDILTGIQIQKRYSRYGVLTVLNPGRSERGFWLCSYCGYGDAVTTGIPKTHKTSWGTPCKGKMRQVYLGHEFQGDVLELRFVGSAFDKTDQGFWLSLTSALLAGAAKALDIERDDIDGTVLQFGGAGYRSIVLFDNVPGGAGHTQRISKELERVMKTAFTIVDNCPGCSRDQSCNSCLRNFQNQYAHDLLKRGPVADTLGKIISSLYKQNEEGYFPLGVTDRSRWLEQLFRRSRRIDILLDKIPIVKDGQINDKEWYSIINLLIDKGADVHLFFRQKFNELLRMGPDGKVALHLFAAFAESPNVKIYTIPESIKANFNAYIDIEDGVHAIRWPQDQNPFEGNSDIELSVLTSFTSSAEKELQNYVNNSSTKQWDLDDINKLLQSTIVIPIKSNTSLSWKDILLPVLPDSIEEVSIYDRFIRNIYQFKSLEMLLEAFAVKAYSDGLSVQITTTATEGFDTIRSDFKKLAERFMKKGVKIQDNIMEPNIKLPHYRKIDIKAKNKNICIWLDRGIDIFRFINLNPPKYITLDSYIVIEEDEKK